MIKAVMEGKKKKGEFKMVLKLLHHSLGPIIFIILIDTFFAIERQTRSEVGKESKMGMLMISHHDNRMERFAFSLCFVHNKKMTYIGSVERGFLIDGLRFRTDFVQNIVGGNRQGDERNDDNLYPSVFIRPRGFFVGMAWGWSILRISVDLIIKSSLFHYVRKKIHRLEIGMVKFNENFNK